MKELFAEMIDFAAQYGQIQKKMLKDFCVPYALMDENGMDKFVAMLSGMLFMIEHNDVESDQAFGTMWDINDFESGQYDDLFTAKDLTIIKADIKKIKDYLSEHQELLED